MKKTFLNISNHPSNMWNENQMAAAGIFGEVRDLKFPAVDPMADEEDVAALAAEVFDCAMKQNPAAVMCQGEFTLSFQLIRMFLEAGIPCVAACTARVAHEEVGPDGISRKTSTFEFVKFRRYR